MGIIQFDGFLDKSNPMPREEVVALLEKGKEYPNYYYSPRDTFLNKANENITEVYIKDNVKKIVYNNEISNWANYNTDEDIHFIGYKQGTQKKYVSISKLSENGAIEGEKYSQMGYDYSLIADTEHFNFNFKYLGEKKIDNRTCVLVKVWNKETLEFLSTKFVIDKETGLVIERMDYIIYGILPVKMKSDRNIKLDIVTDEEMVRPDMTGYEILQ